MHDAYTNNAEALSLEIDWLRRKIHRMLAMEAAQAGAPPMNAGPPPGTGGSGPPLPVPVERIPLAQGDIPEDAPPPELPPESWYARFIESHALDGAERLVIMLALLPEICPELPEAFTSLPPGKAGGVSGKQHRGFVPTVQTALFLLAGDNILYNQAGRSLFHPQGKLLSRHILFLGPRPPGEPLGCAPLFVESDVASYLTSGHVRPPVCDSDFPASLLTTRLEWEDLIVPPAIKKALLDIGDWLEHGQELLARFSHARPGFKALFHGPPGTGKTLATTLLGKKHSLPVYRVDISQAVSKYIGETEKNLERLFSKAERQNWVLFFDEADALFSKRGDANSANDRYANQNTAYLLQRVEQYAGLVVMATNLRDNIDKAMTRRLNTTVYFPRPGSNERARIWENALAGQLRLPRDFSLHEVAWYDLNGGEICNIVQRLALRALKERNFQLTRQGILEAMEREKPEMSFARQHP